MERQVTVNKMIFLWNVCVCVCVCLLKYSFMVLIYQLVKIKYLLSINANVCVCVCLWVWVCEWQQLICRRRALTLILSPSHSVVSASHQLVLIGSDTSNRSKFCSFIGRALNSPVGRPNEWLVWTKKKNQPFQSLLKSCFCGVCCFNINLQIWVAHLTFIVSCLSVINMWF